MGAEKVGVEETDDGGWHEESGDNANKEIASLENGEEFIPVVYARRHLILLAYGLTMFAWNMQGARYVSIAPTYALFFNTTNNVALEDGELGIDFMPILDSAILTFTYFLGAWMIDRFGLISMNLGAFCIMVGSWMWYAGTLSKSYGLVLAGRAVGDVFGTTVSAALLAVSNRWYPSNERGKATAIGALINSLGSGAALIAGPLFATESNEIIDINLKSCKFDQLADNIKDAVVNATLFGTTLDCTGDFIDAQEQFCCYLPANIELYDLIMAILPTLTFIFTVIVTRNRPPTPPSLSQVEPKDFVGLITGLRMLFTNEAFAKLALSDFIVSGPPLVLYATISRIFPAEVAEYSFLASAAGLALALPTSIIVAHFLDKYKQYWTYTMAGYGSGTVFWIIGTICFAAGTTAGAYTFLLMIVLAVAMYVVWQTAVFETKLEYAFSKVDLEGYIVGSDRIVINLSSILFILAIPPERTGTPLNTFIIGAVVMTIGCIPTAVIRNKYRYLRKAYEDEASNKQ